MAWSVLQSASTAATATGSTTWSATYGSNCTSGTKLVVHLGWAGSTATVSSVKDGAGNTFTQLGVLTNSTGGVALYALDTPAGDVGIKPVITATWSVTTFASVVVQEVSGLLAGNTTAMADGTAATGAFAASASDTQPAYTSTAAGEMLLSVQSDDGGPQTGAITGYTLDANAVNNNPNANCVPAYKNSTNGAESGTWTFTGTTTATTLLVAALKIAAVAAPRPALPIQGAQRVPPPAPPPSQIISAPVTYRPVVTLSGSGTLTATAPGVGGQPQLITAPVQPPQPVQPPPGRLIGLTPGAFTGGAALSGTGTLTAAPYFDATGTVLSGSGTLAAAPTVLVPATGVIRAPAQPPQPPAPAPSQITGAAPVITFTVGATLTGSGTLIAAPFFSAAATLSGSGTLTAGPGVGGFPVVIQPPVPQPAQPPPPPPSRVLTAPPALLLGSATLTGSGTLAAVPYFAAAAALSGAGTLAASYTVAGAQPYVITAVSQPPQPKPPPAGQLLTAPTVTLLGVATLTGSGTLSAVETISIAAALSGIGTLAATYIGPPGFTVGTLTASDKPAGVLTGTTTPGGSGGVLTASDTRTGGPGG